MKHKLAIIGTCQVTGMRLAAIQLRPDLHVDAYHVGAQFTAEEVAEKIFGFDTVISQIVENDQQFPALSPSAIRGSVGNLISIPKFVFTGLHPDMLYIFQNGRPVPGYFSEMHSLIVVSSYIMGLSEARTTRLFNAYVFAELGYFACYELSHGNMLAQFAAAGYNLEGCTQKWLNEHGSFMYTVNHPSIEVLAHLAVESLKRAELVSPETLPPADVEDHLYQSFVAPVFSPLARRIGVAENDVFLKPTQFGSDRGISLSAYVNASFDIYRQLDPNVLMSDEVRRAVEILRAKLRY